jgi:signal peptidase I
MLKAISIVTVRGKSMEPTVKDGEKVLAYTPLSQKQFRRGMLVTLCYCVVDDFTFPQHILSNPREHDKLRQVIERDLTRTYIKRLIGLPHDKMPGKTYTAGKSTAQLCYQTNEQTETGKTEWQVPSKMIFVLRDGTLGEDSRNWGPIPMSSLRQIVLCRYPSLRRIR